MKLDKILVPLDGSPLAEAALPKAVELAEEPVEVPAGKNVAEPWFPV